MEDQRRKRSRWVSAEGFFVGASVLLFIASLTQSRCRLEGDDHPGAACVGLLLIGWIGVLGGIYAWLANPAILGAWILIWSRRMRPLAFLCAGAALAFALSFLRVKKMDRDESGEHVERITSYGVGYWIWIASIGTILLGCIWTLIRDWMGFTEVAHQALEPKGS